MDIEVIKPETVTKSLLFSFFSFY